MHSGDRHFELDTPARWASPGFSTTLQQHSNAQLQHTSRGTHQCLLIVHLHAAMLLDGLVECTCNDSRCQCTQLLVCCS